MTALLLIVLGLAMSAFWSGSEIGFYRSTRLRLRLDALRGGRVQRWLWWLVNRPALFVATILIGNNLANAMAAQGATMAGSLLPGLNPSVAELLLPLILTPFIFIYGELLPKHIYYQAPYRLLTRSAPVLLGFCALFLPVSLLLTGLSRILERLVGVEPPRTQLRLARPELRKAIEEGQEAGVLSRAQRRMAQGLFTAATRSAAEFATPAARVIRSRMGMTQGEALRLARRNRQSAIVVEAATAGREIVGYVRVIDLQRDPKSPIHDVRPLIEVTASKSHIATLVAMHNASETMARIVDTSGATVGVVAIESLMAPLFDAG